MDGYQRLPQGPPPRRVSINDVHFNEWSPEPTRGEIYEATARGLVDWVPEMCAINATAEEDDYVDFLCTVATSCHFGLGDNVEAQRAMALMLEGGSSSDQADGEVGLSDRQRVTLTSLLLWTWEEHIPRQTLIVILLTHFSMWRPYVHSKEYDLANMEKITKSLLWWVNVLHNASMVQCMTQTPKFVCADPQVPPPEESWFDGSDSSEGSDMDRDQLECGKSCSSDPSCGVTDAAP